MEPQRKELHNSEKNTTEIPLLHIYKEQVAKGRTFGFDVQKVIDKGDFNG